MKKNTKQKSVSNSKNSQAGVRPLGDRVLIRPRREEEKRIGALIIPVAGEREKPDTGVIVAVGDGKWVDGTHIPVSVHVGDTVMFSKYSYDELTYNGEELYIIKEDNILAVIGK